MSSREWICARVAALGGVWCAVYGVRCVVCGVWCVVRVHLLVRFRMLVWFGLPTVVESKIATYTWQEAQLVF
jgi:hypothetical protein